MIVRLDFQSPLTRIPSKNFRSKSSLVQSNLIIKEIGKSKENYFAFPKLKKKQKKARITLEMPSINTRFIRKPLYVRPDASMGRTSSVSTHSKKLPEPELVARTPQILGKFANTYTYTKSMAERMLKKYRGHVPVMICRPSIIGCSAKEPVPGWVDSLAAAAAYIHGVSLGIANHVIGTRENLVDIVPVDFVSNGILAATAYKANKDEINVIHLSSSDRLDVSVQDFFEPIIDYNKMQPFDNQWFVPSMTYTKPEEFERSFYFKNHLPA